MRLHPSLLVAAASTSTRSVGRGCSSAGVPFYQRLRGDQDQLPTILAGVQYQVF